MDLDTYSNVMSQRGENPEEIPNGSMEGYTRADIAFKQDCIAKKVVWYNNKRTDWHAFLKNYHPLYSICTVPKQHPFSRGERLVVFICSIALAAILSIFIAVGMSEMTKCDPDEDSEVDDCFDRSVYFCTQMVCSLIAGFIKAVANGISKFIAICPCLQSHSCNNTCRECCEGIGHCLMCLWSCILCLLLILFIMMAVMEHVFTGFIVTFILTNIASWIWSFLLLSCCFRAKWRKEKENKKNQLSKFKVSYVDYERYEKGMKPVHKDSNYLLDHECMNAVVIIPQTEQKQHNSDVLPTGWRAVMTDNGKIYYQNDVTRETQWNKPNVIATNDI